MKKRVICVTLDNEDVAVIDTMAKSRQVSRSAIVCWLIRGEIKKKNRKLRRQIKKFVYGKN